jgi:hypothetical protein
MNSKFFFIIIIDCMQTLPLFAALAESTKGGFVVGKNDAQI